VENVGEETSRFILSHAVAQKMTENPFGRAKTMVKLLLRLSLLSAIEYSKGSRKVSSESKNNVWKFTNLVGIWHILSM
jgi:hypothetical protein